MVEETRMLAAGRCVRRALITANCLRYQNQKLVFTMLAAADSTRVTHASKPESRPQYSTTSTLRVISLMGPPCA